MAIERPGRDDLAEIAGDCGLPFDAADGDSLQALVGRLLGSYDDVERLYRARMPEPPERGYRRPADAENPLGAWSLGTDVPPVRNGPLAGRRIAIKDGVAVAGVPMLGGASPADGFVPARDATVVSRILSAGATITGTSVCEDLGAVPGGGVRNPWNPARSAGGSSSGSAALVATGEVDLAVGGGAGGAVRVPSACCGTVGHKPTHGLVPYTGAVPVENTLDHLGPLTRTVHDAAVLLGVLAGQDGFDHRQRSPITPVDYLDELDGGVDHVRIGVVEEGFGIPGVSEEGVDETVRAAVRALEDAGAKVSTVELPWHRDGLKLWNVIATDGATSQHLDGNGYGRNTPGLYDPELVAHFAAARAGRLSAAMALLVLCGRYVLGRHGGRHYAMARNLALELTAAYDAMLTEVDVLVMPTLPAVAPPRPAPDAPCSAHLAWELGMRVNTAPFDVTGHPATSVPAGLVDGLPVGMMIVGRRFDDGMCLRVAHAYENTVDEFPVPPGY